MKRSVKLSLFIVIAIIVIIQLIPSDLPGNNKDTSKDIFTAEELPSNIKTLLTNSCYDCHSNHTRYPWYSYIAPVSWLIKSDVKEGRKHLNFSEWKDYSAKKKMKVLEEIGEEVEEGEMPLGNYTAMHKEASLNEQEIQEIVSWSKKMADGLEQ